MTMYERLMVENEGEGISIKEKKLNCSADGLISGSRIIINKALITSEKACTLAEELGHYQTTSGDILDPMLPNNRKQELRARIWAYDKLIGLMGIVDAYKHHCHDLPDMADYLDVTEEFLKDSLTSYKAKYGICTRLDNYVIYFEPTIGVLELI